MAAPRLLTFRKAATVAGVEVRTLHRWRAAGMRTVLDEKGHRRVREDELMKHKRLHLQANPAHQYRMRKLARDTPENAG